MPAPAPATAQAPPRPRWSLKPVAADGSVDALAARLNDLPHPLARALVLRGVDSFDAARVFFRSTTTGLHDPFLMRDMDRAAERVARAVRERERVVVYGDYDVDGTTSTAMMWTFLRAMGCEASYFIPNRFTHGYGLGREGLDEAAERGAGLVVALDCGVTAVSAAEHARSLGLDLVVCDHHEPGPALPETAGLLDPKRADCDYPFDGLSGCGVGFKLIQAVLHVLGRPEEEAWPYLDLVAVSTAADLVPMSGENRILMQAGLERLRRSPRVGLQALAEQARVDLGDANASSVVFRLGPRLNAAGRIGHAGLSAELLAATDPDEARRLVAEIEAMNDRRRELDQQTRTEAIAIAERMMLDEPSALVVYKSGWHAGVIGITASRVVDRFHRPAVLLTSKAGGVAKGSARSVKGIDIRAALEACSDLLDRFGGHAFAAGLSLPVENVPALRERFAAAVERSLDDPEVLVPEVELDAHLDLQHLTPRFWRVLKQFGPHGPGNLRPAFWGRDLRVVGTPSCVGASGQHLRLRVAQREGGPTFPLIGFNLADRYAAARRAAEHGRPLEVAFTVDENTWRGTTSLQLRAEDVRAEGDA